MKKIIFLLIGAIFLSGCGLKTAVKEKVQEKAQEEFKGTLEQAMKLGVPMKCEWQYNEDKGMSLVKGKSMYVEMTNQGKTGYLIQKDGCLWAWGADQPQGSKWCTNEAEIADPNPTIDKENFKTQGINLDVEYKCSPALVGDDKFNPPSDINFLDLQQMMQGLTIPSLPPMPVNEAE